VNFDPPLTNSPQALRAVARGGGACSGTLVDRRGRSRRLDHDLVRYRARSTGDQSCAAAAATGAGSLKFDRGKVRFDLSETRAGAAGALRFRGATDGSAEGTAVVSQSEDPVAIVDSCGGEGLAQVEVDISLTTTPALSG